MAKLARVAIIGRANVGKSTLFNRLTSGPKAIVAPKAGTTRDRKEGICTWLGKQFTLVDTGGLDIKPHDPIEEKIAEQALVAASQADLILFVVNVKDGITPVDTDIANLLRSYKKQILLVVNKADTKKGIENAAQFYKLGYKVIWPISAANGSGTGDLLDEITKKIKTRLYQEDEGIKVAIIGKPNVGKSSLINALTGEERSIVHDKPYTTRDTNEISIIYDKKPIILLDTAGIRRKAKIDIKSLEKESVRGALESIRKADVVLLVTESQKKLTAQDMQLANLVRESNASVIIIGNKWDLTLDKDEKMSKKFEDYYRKHLNFISWAPFVLMSAKEKTKLTKLFDLIISVYTEQSREITDNALSKFLKKAVKWQKPMIGKGTKKPYIHRIKQVGIKPPQFIVYIDAKSNLQYNYLNFLQRLLREKFGFVGAPIKMWVEKTEEKIHDTSNRPRKSRK